MDETPLNNGQEPVDAEIVSEEELDRLEGVRFDVQENAHVAAISYAYILSLVVLALRRESKFCRFHARQGAVLFFLALIGLVLPGFLRLIVELVLFLAMAYGFLQASQGNWYKMPVVYALLERDPKSPFWQGLNRMFVAMKDGAARVLRRKPPAG